ncbi:hypothetical protein LCM02_07980 [Lutimonas saemankumensis]|uniref:hypothetical protein n=1 Tax=Lutimonas saemankumensis TaxID=483016 RepID=UPI001CD7FE1D|nr:hypothetical protein [Lutimonas saemankumensis]MCA0932387.1 hypothetical protein [Lutimonas saemankumensis]
MKKFISKLTMISLPFIIVPIIFIVRFGYPPPKLSSSLSFNAKILFIKENHLQSEIDVLAIGSSMSLNNLHTETLKNKFDNKFLNISSWGQNIEEDFRLIKIFDSHYKPRIIIINSGYMDFKNNSKSIDYNLVENYLFENGNLVYRNINLKYLIKESKDYFLKKKDTLNYTSLTFDDCGGINLQKSNFNIDPKRWEGIDIKNLQLNINQYNYLDSISQYCMKKNIKLVFIQNPFRKNYYLNLDDQALNLLGTHINKIKSILNKRNQLFINPKFTFWEDSLFIDYSHFSKEGSKYYTEYCLNKIN